MEDGYLERVAKIAAIVVVIVLVASMTGAILFQQ
jgi:hypothetical protein